jgi:Na+(H+)/acetate symporter ActP
MIIGMIIVLFMPLGGMKGITYTSSSTILRFDFALWFLQFYFDQMTGNPIPQLEWVVPLQEQILI